MLLKQISASKLILFPILYTFLFAAIALMPTTASAQEAFPNAAGHGKGSIGGRGGEVVIVNTTADVVNSSDNFISLREAIEVETGPRIITFAVGGVFDMGRDVILLRNDANITIAGQSAPSPGVIIKSAGMEIKNSHDIIIRHLTFRNIDPGGGLANNSDCISIRATARDTYNLMMDHISCSWATDNGLSTYMSASNRAGLAIRDVSLTNSIVAEGDADSQHDESEAGLPDRYLHAMGWNINSITMDSEIRDISVVRNMFAHNARRNPRCTANTSCNIINNIVYNWVSVGSQVSHSSWNGNNHVNIVNNLYKKGPSWSPGDCGTNTITLADHAICGDTGTNNHHHIEGNRAIPYPQTGPLPGNSSLIETIENTPSIAIESPIQDLGSLTDPSGIHLRCIGNSRPVRDEIDQRIINEFINGTGRAGIANNHQRDYSIYPSNQTAHSAAFQDSDQDGMPDAWETKYGLSVGTNDSTWHTLNGSYTNLEIYLNAMATCPTINITSPQADQVVGGTTGTTAVSFETTWETWTDGPSIHYAINGADQGIYQSGDTLILEDLQEGHHELRLTLMNADGTQTGISDSVSFFYTVDSAPSPNPTAQPSPPGATLPTDPQNSCGPLTQEAESGALFGNFTVGYDGNASGGSYIHAPEGTGNRGFGQIHRAEFCFNVTDPGTYRILGGVYAANGNSDSFFVTVNGAPAGGYRWDVQPNTQYLNDYIGVTNGSDPLELALTAGEQTITFHVRDDGTRLDKITLERVDSPPNNNGCGPLTQEAEIGELFGNFTVGYDGNASGGRYIHTPEGTGNQSFGQAHRAEFCFNVSQAGTYRLLASVHAANGSSDSFFVTVDGAPANGYLWDVLPNTQYEGDYVSSRNGADPVELTLAAGAHTIAFHARDDGTRLDKITLEPLSQRAAASSVQRTTMTDLFLPLISP